MASDEYAGHPKLDQGDGSYMKRDAYTRLWNELLEAGEGDRFAVRFYCPMAKSSSYDKDCYVTREGTITELHTGGISFEADGTAEYGHTGVRVHFETDDGARYKARLVTGSTPAVHRYYGRRSSRDGWVRQSRAVTGAMVTPKAEVTA